MGRAQAGPSDHELVRLAQTGNQQAVTDLYVRFKSRVFNYLYRFTGNRAATEDLTQETFIRVYRALPRYRPTGSVAGWIYRIAGNLALNGIRHSKTLKEVSLQDEFETDEGETYERGSTLASEDLGPEELAEASETGLAIQRALTKVSPVYRQVVILCDIEDHAYKEAAQILRISINTVASRLARGRTQMAKELGYLKKEIK